MLSTTIRLIETRSFSEKLRNVLTLSISRALVVEHVKEELPA